MAKIRFFIESEKEYLDKVELSKAINVTEETARKYILEVEELALEGFYPIFSILRKDRLLRVNYYTIIHYLAYANQIKEPNLKKKVPKLDAKMIQEFLGHQKNIVN